MAETHETADSAAPESFSPEKADARFIRQWLLTHPDFFLDHPDLLDTLRFPAPDDPERTLSLLQYRIERLRQQKNALEDDIGRLVSIAQDNAHLFQRMHRLYLDLMAAETHDEMLARLTRTLQALFKVETVFLHSWEAPASPVRGLAQIGLQAEWRDALKAALKPRTPMCGPVIRRWQKLLTHGQNDQVRSLCAIPLGFGRVWGVLTLGTLTRERFREDRDTIFLQQLGDFLSARLGPLFEDPWPGPQEAESMTPEP